MVERHRRDRFFLAAVLLAFAHAALGLWLLPGSGFAKYPDGAALLAQGRLPTETAGNFSPLYLWWNLALSPGVLRISQQLLSASAVVAVYLAAARWIGQTAGLFASALLAFAVPLFVYAHVLEPDVAILALSAWALATFPRAGERLSGSRASALGILLGAIAGLRPFGLLLLGGVALAMVFRARRTKEPPLPPLLLGALGVVVALAPGVALSWKTGSELGGTMSLGAVFHMGNRPEGTGIGAQPPFLLKMSEAQQRSPERPDLAHNLYRAFARLQDPGATSTFSTQGFWVKKVFRFATAEPWAFARLWGRKAAFFFFGRDAHDVSDALRAEARLDSVPLLSGKWLVLLGLAGCLHFLWFRRGVSFGHLFIAAAALMSVVFYCVARYRLAALPAFSLFGGYLLSSVVVSVRERKLRELTYALAALLFAVLPAYGLPALRDGDRMLERAAVASAAGAEMERSLYAGQLAPAREALIRMLAAQPYSLWTRDPRGLAFEDGAVSLEAGRLGLERFGLATPVDLYMASQLAIRAGACAQAAESAPAGFSWAIYDALLDSGLLAARCLRQSGDLKGAWRQVLGTLSRRPGALDALASAVAAARAHPELEDGETAGRTGELWSLHDQFSVHFALARGLREWGDPAAALGELDALDALLPGQAIALYERALAEAELGQTAAAARAYAGALAAFPQHAFETHPLDASVTAVLAAHPDDPTVLSLAAEHALRAGRLVEAREKADASSALLGGRAGPAHAALVRLLARLSPRGPAP